jgi:hypothetical protein
MRLGKRSILVLFETYFAPETGAALALSAASPPLRLAARFAWAIRGERVKPLDDRPVAPRFSLAQW